MANHLVTRRGFVGGTAASLVLASGMQARAADTVVGFIYVGPRDDFGWNQSHAVAAATLKKTPGIKVIEEENVPETDAVAKTIESMITFDNASLIFATSFGYFDPFMIEMARKYPRQRKAIARRYFSHRASNPARTEPVAPQPTTATREEASFCCPDSPMGRKRIWRE